MNNLRGVKEKLKQHPASVLAAGLAASFFCLQAFIGPAVRETAVMRMQSGAAREKLLRLQEFAGVYEDGSLNESRQAELARLRRALPETPDTGYASERIRKAAAKCGLKVDSLRVRKKAGGDKQPAALLQLEMSGGYQAFIRLLRLLDKENIFLRRCTAERGSGGLRIRADAEVFGSGADAGERAEAYGRTGTAEQN